MSAAAQQGRVRYRAGDGVALVTLDRPRRRNALDGAMIARLTAAMARAEADPAVAVVVLAATGPVFGAGMDLVAFTRGERGGATDPDRFAGFVNRPRAKPVIAAVQGPALAGGFELVLACDLAIAAEEARFALTETSRGLIAGGGGAIRLPRRLPLALANEMLLAARGIDAARALRHGLVAAVVPRAQVLPRALATARAIATAAPQGVQAARLLAERASRRREADLWHRMDRLWHRLEQAEDTREGALAFAEKRPPRWRGR